MKVGWWRMWSSLPNLTHFRKKNGGRWVALFSYIPGLFYGMLSIIPGYCVLTSGVGYHVLVAGGSDGGGSVHTELIRGSHPLGGKSRGDFKGRTWLWRRGSCRDSCILITSGRFTEMLGELLICLNRKGVLPSKLLGAQEVNTRELRSNRYPEVCWGPCYK